MRSQNQPVGPCAILVTLVASVIHSFQKYCFHISVMFTTYMHVLSHKVCSLSKS